MTPTQINAAKAEISDLYRQADEWLDQSVTLREAMADLNSRRYKALARIEELRKTINYTMRHLRDD